MKTNKQIWFPRGVCPAVGHMAVLFPVFEGICTLFSIVAIPVCTPTNRGRSFPFSPPSPAFIVCRHFDDGHSDQREMITHCVFHLHFSNNL